MAFKLKGCDRSDLQLWAKSIPAENFFGEVEQSRAVALRRLIKEGTEENAIAVRTFDEVLRLYKESQK